MALITMVLQGPEHNRALGVRAAIGSTGAAFGVLLGGVLVSGIGWFGSATAWLPLLGSVLGAALFAVAERQAATPPVRLPFPARHSLVGGCILMLAASGVLISAC
ncbi:hypothetical protein ACIQU8_12405 [Streptomyces griseus]|uniref:hypothetical protein n=1 Tax=Streptomyces griseus TaxID=1911 RepID=UPI00380B38DD